MPTWHEWSVIFSFFAAIVGLTILLSENQAETEPAATERMLFIMSFAYWLVYCAAVAAKKVILPEWELLLLSVKLTGALAYLLTATSILSLPLHQISVKRQAE